MCVHSCTSPETIVLERIAGFDWDDGNWPKCGKHGVSRDEIEAALTTGPDVYPDRGRGPVESRYNAVGRAAMGRSVFIVFTIRRHWNGMKIRPISARYMHRKEVLRYEQTRG